MYMPVAVKSASWITRTFHGLPGRWRIVQWLRRHEDAFKSLAPTTIRMDRAYRMTINPADFDGMPMYIHGFDPQDWIGRVFEKVVRPGDNVLDVGANVGYYTLLAAKLVGAKGEVHAFEASPRVLQTLTRNLELNPHAPITLHGQAVSNACGHVEFHTASSNHTGLSSMRDLGSTTAEVTRVPAITLDSILDDLPPIRLVKVDVEGAEMLVVEGMPQLIARDKPFILLELTDAFLRELGSSAAALCSYLESQGYALYRIGTGAGLTPFDEPPTDQCNILAQHRDCAAKII